MGPSANDFSNRRRPGRRGDGPGMGPGRGPARGPSPGGGSPRGPGGGPRDGARGRTGRGLNDPRRPSASTFRRIGPRPEGQGPGQGQGGFEGRRWTRDREEGPTGETWRRGEGGGQRPSVPEDRPKWRMGRRPEGPPARPFRPVRPVRPLRGEAPPPDTEQPRGDSHAAAAPSELIWGRHAALAALESERPIHRIWCTPEMRFRPTFLQLLREAKASGVLVEEVTWARLGQISGGAVHQGIVLQPAAADTLDLPSLIDGCRKLGEAPLLVAVDGLTDPQNLGAILRSAEALGVHGLVLPQRRNAGLTGSVAKVAAGALEHLPVARVVNLNRSLETLRQEGYRVVGLDPQGSVSLEEADLEGPLVVITGSEGQGLSVLTRRSCDQLVRIPLRGSTPSLNASVATALVLYEVARRGWMRGLRGMAKPPRLVRPNVPTEAPRSEAVVLPALRESGSAPAAPAHTASIAAAPLPEPPLAEPPLAEPPPANVPLVPPPLADTAALESAPASLAAIPTATASSPAEVNGMPHPAEGEAEATMAAGEPPAEWPFEPAIAPPLPLAEPAFLASLDTAAQESALQESAPQGSAPQGSAPQEVVAQEPTLLETPPFESAPLESAPLSSTPLGSAPLGSAPTGSAPQASAPLGSAPLGSESQEDRPQASPALPPPQVGQSEPALEPQAEPSAEPALPKASAEGPATLPAEAPVEWPAEANFATDIHL